MQRLTLSRFAFPLALLASASLLTGCEGTLEPKAGEDISPEAAEAVASLLGEVDFLFAGAVATSTSGRGDFTRTFACPAGGSVSVAGSNQSSLDEQTRVVSTQWSTTQTHAACATTHTRGDKSVTAVVNGSVTSSGTSSYLLPTVRGGDRTLLSWASTRVGSTTTTVGERTATCAVNVSQTYDPATRTFTTTGTVCGREVTSTRRLGG